MSDYQAKLIELVNIETDNDQSLLRINLSFEQDTEMVWQVDQYTAENLRSASAFDQQYKHRISFHSSFDPIRKCYVSFLTRTHRDQSDKVYFCCSEEFVKALYAIKHTQSTNDLVNLNFLSRNLAENDEPEQKNVQDGYISKKYNKKPTWVAVALIGIISTVLFGYSSHALKTISDEKASTNADTADSELNLTQEVDAASPITSSVELNASDQPSIPKVELNSALTYSIREGSVALTFDDGPSKFSKKIVDILKDYQVGGTFFFIGKNVKKHPDYVRYVHSNGFTIGTHSTNHVHVSGLSYKQQEDELTEATQLIEEITNEKVDLFRPPYGDLNQLTIDLMNEHHNKMVLWNKDPKDWKHHNAKKIVNYIRDSNVSGSIILLHESKAVIDALPQIIEYLLSQGLEIVNLT
ncbi:polysaccharide deacetylase family protein [Virgibacillus sp. JSM 102003]|uniref:polysaccharide deacetylase family protein n=1 Tax=Virgibacillus sp. JSM 102003 TaxID=1562108 RepID=UPI0035BFE981